MTAARFAPAEWAIIRSRSSIVRYTKTPGLPIEARSRRDERRGARRNNHCKVCNLASLRGLDNSPGSVDGDDFIPQVEGNILLGVAIGIGEHQLLGIAAGKILAELHAVVCRPGLFAECDNPILPVGVQLGELLAQAMSNHAIANHNNGESFIRLGRREHVCDSSWSAAVDLDCSSLKL